MTDKRKSPDSGEQRVGHGYDSSDNANERTTASQFVNPHYSHADDPEITFDYGAASRRAESPTSPLLFSSKSTGNPDQLETCPKKMPSERCKTETDVGENRLRQNGPNEEQECAYQELDKALENQEIHQWFRRLSFEQKKGVMTTFHAAARTGANHMRDKDRYGLEAILEEPPDFSIFSKQPRSGFGKSPHMTRYGEEHQLPAFRSSGYDFEPVQPAQSSPYSQSGLQPAQVPPTRPRASWDSSRIRDPMDDGYVPPPTSVYPARGRTRDFPEARGARRRVEPRSTLRDMPTGVLGYFDAKKGTWSSFKTRFELLARNRDWSAEECRIQLICSLRGAAADCLDGFLDGDFSYGDLVHRIDSIYGGATSKESWWAELQQRSKDPDESWAKFIEDVKMLTIKAHPEISHQYGAVESIAKQAVFWKIDDPVLKGQLAMHNPKTLEALKQLATLYESSKQSPYKRGRKPIRQNFYSDAEHYREGPYEDEDEWEDFLSDDSEWEEYEVRENKEQNKMRGKPSLPKDIVCFNCNKKGHISPRCPEKVDKTGKWRPQRRPFPNPPLASKVDLLEKRLVDLQLELKNGLAKLLGNQERTEEEQDRSPATTAKQNPIAQAIRDVAEALMEQEVNHLN